jgi:hypothetical protein
VREKLFNTGRIRHHALPKASAALRKVWNVKDNHTLTIQEVARMLDQFGLTQDEFDG